MSSINISELNLVDFDALSSLKSQMYALSEAEFIHIFGGESGNENQTSIIDIYKELKNRFKVPYFPVSRCQKMWHPTLEQYITVC